MAYRCFLIILNGRTALFRTSLKSFSFTSSLRFLSWFLKRSLMDLVVSVIHFLIRSKISKMSSFAFERVN